jgi:hypothetical protein
MEMSPALRVTEDGKSVLAPKIIFYCTKPRDETGQIRDQTGDAARHIRLAAERNLPRIKKVEEPNTGKAIIVGGGPSIADQLDKIKEFAADKNNAIFALNWAHTWLIKNGILPTACVMFEIDVDPCQIIDNTHPDVTYYVCTHCHPLTLDGLKDRKVVLWHSPPNSPGEKIALDELFPGDLNLGGGIATFLRSMSIALVLGYRQFELFGVDSSFPDDYPSTHIIGYPTITSPKADGIFIYAKDDKSGEVRRFKTVGYLAYQVEEFIKYLKVNHMLFRLKVHGDTLLAFVHRNMWAHQYEEPECSNS